MEVKTKGLERAYPYGLCALRQCLHLPSLPPLAVLALPAGGLGSPVPGLVLPLWGFPSPAWSFFSPVWGWCPPVWGSRALCGAGAPCVVGRIVSVLGWRSSCGAGGPRVGLCLAVLL